MRGSNTVAVVIVVVVVVIVGAVAAEWAQHIMQFLQNYYSHSLHEYFMIGAFMASPFIAVSIFLGNLINRL